METVSDEEFSQSIVEIAQQLPLPVQRFLAGPERSTTMLLLVQKYNLRVDQAWKFERSFIYLLLGMDSPADFTKNLQEIGIEKEAISGLVADINEQVFKRLREQERSESAAPTPPRPAPMPPPSLIPPPQAPQPPLQSMPPVQSQAPSPQTPPAYTPSPMPQQFPVNAIAAPPVVPRYAPPPAVLPGQEAMLPLPVMTPPPQSAPPVAPYTPPQIPVSASLPPQVASVAPSFAPPPPDNVIPQAQGMEVPHISRTMVGDMQALRDGVDPVRVAHPAPPAWAALAIPTQIPQSESYAEPPTAAPPATAAQPLYAPAPREPISRTPTATDVAMRGDLKQYGIDPYREPVE